MAITYGVAPVRSANLTATSTTATFAVTSAPSNGSLLVCAIGLGNLTATITSVTDTKTNNYNLDNSLVMTAFSNTWMFSTLQTQGTLTTSDTITVTFNTSVSGFGVSMDMREFIGATNIVDSVGSNSNGSNSTGPTNTGTLSPISPGCALIAACTYGNVATATFNATGTVGTYLDTQTTNLTVGSNSRDFAGAYLLNPGQGVSQQLDLTFSSGVVTTSLLTAYRPIPTPSTSAIVKANAINRASRW